MLNKKKKITIISLLSLVIVLLFILLFADNEKSKTIMIYMVGSDLESESGIATSDLNGIIPSEINLKKTNILLYTGGTSEWKNFISNEENAIYILESTGFKKIQTYDKENMGSPETLSTFLNYGYNNYKTDIYDLILYDHGGALNGAIYDDFTNDNLSLSDFSIALESSSFNKKNKLDVVLFRTCLNGTIEVANVFKDYANYLVSSEEVSYGSNGYSVLSFLNETQNVAGAEYGKKFIDHYDNLMKEIDRFGFKNITYSVTDLSKIDDINKELDNFIDGIVLENNYQNILKVRADLLQYAIAETGVYDTVDLYSLVSNLGEYSTYDNKKLLNLIDESIVFNYSSDLDSSHGLAIYFPYNGEDIYQKYFLKIYNDLNYCDSYKEFINEIYKFRNDEKSSSLLNKDMTNNISSQNGKVSITLNNYELKDYSTSRLDVYVKTKEYSDTFKDTPDDVYSLIYTTTNSEIKDNVISYDINNSFIEIYDDNENYGYLSVIERASIKGQPERVFGTYGRLGLFPDTTYAKFYFDYEGNVPVIRLATYRDEDENSARIHGNIIDVNSYDDIYFNVYAYRFNEIGNFIESNDTLNYMITWHETPSLLKLRKASFYKELDYYVRISIHDIYGNIEDTKLIKING